MLVSMGLLKTRVIPALVGRRGKYLVALFWVVVLAASFSLAGKLMGAEKNDATAWLPGSAESTKVLNEESSFQAPNTFAAIVVFQRLPALTGTDRARIEQDARTFARTEPLGGPVIGAGLVTRRAGGGGCRPPGSGTERLERCRRRRQ